MFWNVHQKVTKYSKPSRPQTRSRTHQHDNPNIDFCHQLDCRFCAQSVCFLSCHVSASLLRLAGFQCLGPKYQDAFRLVGTLSQCPVTSSFLMVEEEEAYDDYAEEVEDVMYEQQKNKQ
eukprot:2159223-Amphidinium_carterae.1